MSEKEPLLEKANFGSLSNLNNENEPRFKCPALLKSFSFNPLLNCLPQLSKHGEDEQEEFEYIEYSDDDMVLPDLPYVENPVILPNSRLTQKEKLFELRKLMREYGIGVYIIPSEDEHQSEYTSLSDKRREFISGFTGSAGVAIVTLTNSDTLQGQAFLSTDGRYFLQAERQLDSKLWKLIKQGSKNEKPWTEQAIECAVKNPFSKTISCDSRTINLVIGQFFQIKQHCADFRFLPSSQINLVDVVWGDEKPKRSLDPIYHLALKYSGEHTNDKLERIRKIMKEKSAMYYIIIELDSIAWLFNLRCDGDIPFSPVFFSYAIVTLSSVKLYVEKAKIAKEDKVLENYLSTIKGLTIESYMEFYKDVSRLKPTTRTMAMHSESNSKKMIMLPAKSSTVYALYDIVANSFSQSQILHESVIANMKIFKNKTESFNAKIAQYKDSLVFILFGSWLEHQLVRKNAKISEYDAACKMYSLRKDMPNFKGLSYETISSTGANAAIIHYTPTKENNQIIDPNKIYLLDSGGHYLEGTTDITRTYMFGSQNLVSQDYRKYYTLVLKGHLGISMAKFPQHSTNTGTLLDAYSRQPLWNHGLDFNHGVGHGVGSFGLVHEGPLYISPTTVGGSSQLDLFQPGAIVTDEPGFYINNEVGFRVESELEVTEQDSSFGKSKDGRNFLGFDYLTKVPFCNKLIDTKYLTPIEVQWINEYHRDIRNEFAQKLLDLNNKRAFNWLIKETAPIH
ncbi:hypothetical protein KGF56_001754 [Candida oxycetoniae]|uniref:Xaa-Pro aminopeptidase P n=1 Tax=Candida oxycetoniae TaxID=497107 RepID=A0AAI9WYS3_9ASCO|nr:uncharacterized protein KGF56_001754 [Candida oxycetoniae]KAI3405438.2 hypothetical protein KGF56_001754 [Candida oxycetoniae]